MTREAVSDTGPVRHLWEIDHEQILTRFDTVYLPVEVKAELTVQGVFNDLDPAVLERFRVLSVAETEIRRISVRFADASIQPADAAVIGLAQQKRPDVVLTDDLNLRKVLDTLGLTAVGSVGLLIRAFKNGDFGKTELDVKIDRLFTGSTLYLSKAFKSRVKQMIENLPDTP